MHAELQACSFGTVSTSSDERVLWHFLPVPGVTTIAIPPIIRYSICTCTIDLTTASVVTYITWSFFLYGKLPDLSWQPTFQAARCITAWLTRHLQNTHQVSILTITPAFWLHAHSTGRIGCGSCGLQMIENGKAEMSGCQFDERFLFISQVLRWYSGWNSRVTQPYVSKSWSERLIRLNQLK